MSDSVKKGGFDAWLASHPRQALQLSALILISVWQVPVAFLGLLLFLVLTRLLRLRWWWILLAGLLTATLTLFSEALSHHFDAPLSDFIPQLARANLDFLKQLLGEGFSAAFYFLYENLLAYVLGFSLLVAGILATLELIPNSSHERQLRALQRGQKSEVKEIKSSSLEKSLERLDERAHDGVVLGISTYNNRPVILSDEAVNQLALVLGTTGGGKTVTLRRFYQRAMLKNYPLIIVDGKPTDESIAWVEKTAAAYGKAFYGFNGGNHWHYDPLASGGYTELKDKIISLKDQWESDYYRSII